MALGQLTGVALLGAAGLIASMFSEPLPRALQQVHHVFMRLSSLAGTSEHIFSPVESEVLSCCNSC